MWILIRWFCKNPADPDLQCFQKRIKTDSADKRLICSLWNRHKIYVHIALRNKGTETITLKTYEPVHKISKNVAF